MALRTLSLCSGFAGLELGLRAAEPGARTVCYVEGEAYAAACLVARMGERRLDTAPIWSDVRTFDGKPWRGRVDCITGGYPCQPFSLAGKRLGADDPRHLWPSVARIVDEVRPEWCFFENVRGHVSLGLRNVRCDLERMGYRVEAGIFTAAEVGAPHERARLFILAHADDERRKSQRRCGVPNEGKSAQRHNVDGSSCPPLAFPPGPADQDTWWRVLNARPDLEPAICGVAHGLANRVDRLRGCGNGVVPAQAALAWRTLRARFGRTE